MNAIKTIFPESDQQGCYFHFFQVSIKYSTEIDNSYLFYLPKYMAVI
ncbi:hypothetical protein FWK35_00029678 [Aphis craccivora]|uniref:MULE domain-containing protein n=1 Tax=Aphis craccivora TaxID=307492 RepID=A0A6G0VTN8_APHCR|nr:hypothetical protein FWK35_00029678 [Aphis craccivora]